MHHLFSLLEFSYFCIVEWSNLVVDIREQYPLLPVEETVAIAKELGVRHPSDPTTKIPYVMTTDFLLTTLGEKGVCYRARTIKYSQDLSKRRVLEKFEIERIFFKKRKIDWAIVTERDIPGAVVRNVNVLHPYFEHESLHPLSEKEVYRIARRLTELVAKGEGSLSAIAATCDREFGLNTGVSLKVAWHLIAKGNWRIDMTRPIEPFEPLPLLNYSLNTLRLKSA